MKKQDEKDVESYCLLENFAVFCKKCGTYDVDVYINMNEEMVFICQTPECDTKETF